MFNNYCLSPKVKICSTQGGKRRYLSLIYNVTVKTSLVVFTMLIERIYSYISFQFIIYYCSRYRNRYNVQDSQINISILRLTRSKPIYYYRPDIAYFNGSRSAFSACAITIGIPNELRKLTNCTI